MKIGRITLIPRTLSPVLASSLVNMRTPTSSQNQERKYCVHSESSARTAPKRTAPRKTPANLCLPRRSHQPIRHSKTGQAKSAVAGHML